MRTQAQPLPSTLSHCRRRLLAMCARYATLGDFGGSAGVLSCCVAAAHPHMRCTTHDLPAVHEAAVQYIQAQGLSGRVEVRAVVHAHHYMSP